MCSGSTTRRFTNNLLSFSSLDQKILSYNIAAINVTLLKEGGNQDHGIDVVDKEFVA